MTQIEVTTNNKTLLLEPEDAQRLATLCGPMHENIQQLEKRLHIKIHHRGNRFTLEGDDANITMGARILEKLYWETRQGEALSAEKVHLYLQQSSRELDQHAAPSKPSSAISTYKLVVQPRGAHQQSYVEAIRANDINFGIGPAGTGKTWLAVACAVEALKLERIERILLVRPAVEAGEKLGFLPGDLSEKIDPYLRPLYDALYEMMGFDAVTKLIERNIIEVAPLAYMRGRTLNYSFIILDESQNTTEEQMKMFLTRIGFGSTAVITGDITQTDLPKHAGSGLVQASKILKDIDGISFTHFSSKDVMRHPLVQRVVEAYEAHSDQLNDYRNKNSAGKKA